MIDTTTNTYMTSIVTAPLPSSLALSPDGSRAYITHYLAASVSVISLADFAPPINQV